MVLFWKRSLVKRWALEYLCHQLYFHPDINFGFFDFYIHFTLLSSWRPLYSSTLLLLLINIKYVVTQVVFDEDKVRGCFLSNDFRMASMSILDFHSYNPFQWLLQDWSKIANNYRYNGHINVINKCCLLKM